MADYPTWLYNQVAVNQQPAIIVNNAAQEAAFGSSWGRTPFPQASSSAPSDPGFANTDTRLQQLLVESRMQNLMLHDALLPGNLSADDLTRMRAEVLALDSGITT